jgi:hypothetical protein
MKYFETKLKTESNYKEFGKFAINLKLLYNNTLLVKYKKSYAPVPQIKRTQISDELLDIILFLLETNTIDYEKLRELTNQENNLFKLLMMKSGLFDTLKYNYNNTREKISDVIEEYEIIKGEIEAENNNPELPKKAEKVLKKLKNYGKITEAEYKDIVEEL